ncbi:MAG TPA: ATP-dependent DNA ligase [Gemmatimonadaceae bacterium]|nr:ATP-dependent DNA ligase [Gemmatimonadaceae bacterium]
MNLSDIVNTSTVVASTSSRGKKVELLADVLRRLAPNEIAIAIGFLTGWPRQGKLGIGWATLDAARPPNAAADATLTLAEVDQAFTALKAVKGSNSAAQRRRLLGDLMVRATTAEQQFLFALGVGEVRQGALEGVMAEAVAKAANLPADRVRRAAMLAGDLGSVAEAVLAEGEAGLAHWSLQLFRPVQPMLADSAPNVQEALQELGDGVAAALEWKLDGARIQVHKQGDRIAIYTRSLNDVTPAVPEVTEAVRAFPANELILDGEVIALDAAERPLPFQVTMRRFGRRLDVDALRAQIPVSPFFFDILRVDGEDLLDQQLHQRLTRLDAIIPASMRVPRTVTADVEEAKRFEAGALERGHEGLMAKSLSAPYAAGRRGSAWLKVKTARTLDLVVLAVEWGSGRRKGWLSNIHVGARDPVKGGFVMLGKTFKGMTDEILEWQTKELLARETRREGHIVHVRPELVVEVAFNEVQRSPHYPGGVALRFARIKGYRHDKRAEEADTIESVLELAPRP